MRLALIDVSGTARPAAQTSRGFVKLPEGLSTDLVALLADSRAKAEIQHAAKDASVLPQGSFTFLPPVPAPGKIICVGLNYADHAAEGSFARPDYPIYFLRVATTLVGHEAALVRPKVSEQFDYEGEIVAVIGKRGRAIPQASALDHVIGYSLFNEGSIRDYQFKGSQWTLGKNFDGTGAFGPTIVSADEIPPGAQGLRLRTTLNGKVVQDASTNDMLFPVAELVAKASIAMTLEPGDLIITGTPSGVGFARKPPLFMKNGDVCEVSVEGIGLLRNPVRDEGA